MTDGNLLRAQVGEPLLQSSSSKRMTILTRGINNHRNETEFPCKLILACYREIFKLPTGFADEHTGACLCPLDRCVFVRLQVWGAGGKKVPSVYLYNKKHQLMTV